MYLPSKSSKVKDKHSDTRMPVIYMVQIAYAVSFHTPSLDVTAYSKSVLKSLLDTVSSFLASVATGLTKGAILKNGSLTIP